ncbi:MAG: hypothetical protein EHM12_11295 [Dehalococcoidia bacterium]|nr:MAG: hypothetical protein EHM12_11295 [Dehalococcoidia bacterium]
MHTIIEKVLPGIFDKDNENIIILNDSQVEKLIEDVPFLKITSFVYTKGRIILWIDWMSQTQLAVVFESLVASNKQSLNILIILRILKQAK